MSRFESRLSQEPAQAELRAAVDHVHVLVGRPLTAYLAGVASIAALHVGLEKGDESVIREATPRLQFVLELAGLFRARNAVVLLRPWLRDVDDELGHSPAELIRTSADTAVRELLRSHATAYLTAR
jgi:hypothetical protein